MTEGQIQGNGFESKKNWGVKITEFESAGSTCMSGVGGASLETQGQLEGERQTTWWSWTIYSIRIIQCNLLIISKSYLIFRVSWDGMFHHDWFNRMELISHYHQVRWYWYLKYIYPSSDEDGAVASFSKPIFLAKFVFFCFVTYGGKLSLREHTEWRSFC